VSKLTTDVVTYCTEASNQKSKYAYRKILFYKKSTGIRTHNCNIQFSWRTDKTHWTLMKYDMTYMW